MQFGKFSIPALLTLEAIDDAMGEDDEKKKAPLSRLDLAEFEVIFKESPITQIERIEEIENYLKREDPYGYFLITEYL